MAQNIDISTVIYVMFKKQETITKCGGNKGSFTNDVRKQWSA